jgi:hypothetical protein
LKQKKNLKKETKIYLKKKKQKKEEEINFG